MKKITYFMHVNDKENCEALKRLREDGDDIPNRCILDCWDGSVIFIVNSRLPRFIAKRLAKALVKLGIKVGNLC